MGCSRDPGDGNILSVSENSFSSELPVLAMLSSLLITSFLLRCSSSPPRCTYSHVKTKKTVPATLISTTQNAKVSTTKLVSQYLYIMYLNPLNLAVNTNFAS